MKEKTTFLLCYFFYLICFALVNRLIFLCYHFGLLIQLPLALLPGFILSSFQLDVAMSVYILCIPFLLILLFEKFSTRLFNTIVFSYNSLIVAALSIISVADLEIFSVWGFRIDASALQYLNTGSLILQPKKRSVILRTKENILGLLSLWEKFNAVC